MTMMTGAINLMADRTGPIWKATNLHQSVTTQNSIIVIALAAIEKRATKNAPPRVYVLRVQQHLDTRKYFMVC